MNAGFRNYRKLWRSVKAANRFFDYWLCLLEPNTNSWMMG